MQETGFTQSNPGGIWGRRIAWLLMGLGTSLVLITVAIFNYIVDPFGFYQTGFFDPISQINTYQYKLILFKRFKPPPKVLILGSSHTDQVLAPEDVEDITGLRCFSFANAGSTTEIYYATMRLVLEQYKAPIEVVIVGTEILAFVPEGRPIHPMAKTRYEYTQYFTNDPIWPAMYERYSRLWSVEQVTSSYKSIQRKMRGEGIKGWRQWGPDGAPHHDWDNRPGGIAEPTRTGQDITNQRNLLSPRKFAGLSDERKKYWEMFLDVCRENNIKVYAFLTPKHPKLIKELKRVGSEPFFQELIEYLETTVTEVGGEFRDLRDIRTFGGDVKYFRDAYHQTRENGRPLLELLLTDFEIKTDREN